MGKKQQKYFGYLLSNPEERKKKGISKKAAKDFAQDIQEVSPPGWGHTKAEKEKTVIIAEANKEAQTVRGEGDGESVKIYAETFSKDKLPDDLKIIKAIEPGSRNLSK